MATSAPTPTWSYGKVINYTDENAVTDDTEQWSYGQVLSVLEYAAAVGGLSIPVAMHHYLHNLGK